MALFVLSLYHFDISVGIGAFVIGLGQISSFLSLKDQLFLLIHKACISLALPLSLLPFTRDTLMVCLK